MKRDELPALQWYSGDWRKDPGVRVLTFEQRGIWFEMLMVMHESERRGALVLNGKPMTEGQIAQVVGCDLKRFKVALAVIMDTGVASRDENGAIINRRMIKDERIRQLRKAAGSLGGNPALLGNEHKQNVHLLNQSANQSPTPSSSSSSSDNSPLPPKGGRTRGISPKVAFKDFIDGCRSKQQRPISDYQPVWQYAEKVGLPLEFVELAWYEFKRRMSPGGVDESKRQVDWQKTFRNYLEKNYLRLWWVGADGKFALTSGGLIAQKATQEAA
jgi:hypothetical protein